MFKKHVIIFWQLLDLPQSFAKDVQDFVKVLYSSGQTDLSVKQQLDHSENNTFNVYKLIILSNAAFVDLLVWSSDELAGVSLCNALTEKINSFPGHKLAISHYPLLVVCLNGLGELAQKFPNLAEDIIALLRDFLVNPSPILFKLGKQQLEMQNRSAAFKIDSYEESVESPDLNHSSNFVKKVYEQLRDRGINNLCIALRSGVQLDQHCIQAFIASVSNRLYQIDKKDKESNLVITNTLVALGRIAVNLSDIPKTMDSILQFFQQRFCRPPSSLDSLIVEQLAEMVLVQNREVKNDLEFLKLFYFYKYFLATYL